MMQLAERKKSKTDFFFPFKINGKHHLISDLENWRKKKKNNKPLKPVCELASHFLVSTIGVRLTSLVLLVLMLL